MNTLVTGGCGFIGSHLVRKLVNEGDKVTIIDNLSRSSPATIADIVGSQVQFVKGDITDAKFVEDTTRNVDAVIHLAALIDARESVERPAPYFLNNVNGTVNVLNACMKNDVKKFVFASTAAVYGNSVNVPVNEDSLTVPINPYGVSKLSAEGYVKMFSDRSLETVVLRFFNVYGPKASSAYAGVISKFIERVSSGLGPVIYGDGEQTRDFVHVNDVTDAISLALQSEMASGQTFNIGSGQAASVNRLARIIMHLSERNGMIPVYKEPKEGDIKNSCADISKAGRLLKYKPKVTIEQGLGALISPYAVVKQ